MGRFGLVGPSYASQSPIVDAERCVNLYPERIEADGGKTQWVLYPSPGKKIFATLKSPVRGGIEFNGRSFAVGGDTLYETFANGTAVALGTVGNDGNLCSISANPIQLAVVSAGNVYILTFATNGFTGPVTGLNGPIAQIEYGDGYFVALQQNSAIFQFSNLLDGTTWNPIFIDQVSVFPDNLSAIKVNNRDLLLFGRKKGVAYYDSGSNNIYDPIPGGNAERGCRAGSSVTSLDNSVFFLGTGGLDTGGAIGWRLAGNNPVRISNHAVEFVWSTYPTTDDAIGYGFVDQGHSFWHLYFPSGNASWRYDVATGMWHEVGSWLNGAYNADPSQCHWYAFGKHLVGDPGSGNIYDQSINYYDLAGMPLRRLRRSPYISSELQWLFGKRLVIDLETGLGPQPPLLDGAGNARDPQAMLRWSDDGRRWSNEQPLNCGQAGQYKKHVFINRLGRFRQRLFEISMTDPVPWRIADAYFEDAGTFKPTERLVKQLGKMA